MSELDSEGEKEGKDCLVDGEIRSGLEVEQLSIH